MLAALPTVSQLTATEALGETAAAALGSRFPEEGLAS